MSERAYSHLQNAHAPKPRTLEHQNGKKYNLEGRKCGKEMGMMLLKFYLTLEMARVFPSAFITGHHTHSAVDVLVEMADQKICLGLLDHCPVLLPPSSFTR